MNSPGLKWGDEPKTPRAHAVRLWYDKIIALEKSEGRVATDEEVAKLRKEADLEAGVAPTQSAMAKSLTLGTRKVDCEMAALEVVVHIAIGGQGK